MIKEGWKKLAAGIVMLALIKLIDRFVSSNVIALLAEVAAGFAVYCAVVMLLRDSFITDIVFGKILKRKGRA